MNDLLLLVASYRILYFIQRACSSVMLMSNFRTNALEAVQVARSYYIFHFW